MLRVSGYGRTFNPVEHINPLKVLEGGKVSHAVACSRREGGQTTGDDQGFLQFTTGALYVGGARWLGGTSIWIYIASLPSGRQSSEIGRSRSRFAFARSQGRFEIEMRLRRTVRAVG